MKFPMTAALTIVLTLSVGRGVAAPPERDAGGWKASGTQGAVAAGGSGAVEAGIEILKAGGNAADAAVATILALSVTDATSFCFGGEVPIMVYDARRGVVEVAGRPGGGAPAGDARRVPGARGDPGQGDRVRRGPRRARRLPDGAGAVRHPDVRRGGRPHPPPARRAREGLARRPGGDAPAAGRGRGRLARRPTPRPPPGRRLLLPRADRPRDRRLVARQRRPAPRTDLATHVTRIEEPVAIEYRGHTVYKCGPWTQGPSLLQALQLLEGFDLKAIGHNRPDAIHLTVEALEARARRSRRLLRRPPLRGRAARGPPRARVCHGPPRPDRPEAGVPRAAAGRPARARRSWPRPRPAEAWKARRTTRPPAWSPTASATWSRPPPAAGRAWWRARPASGSAPACRASTSGPTTPTTSSRANAPGSR